MIKYQVIGIKVWGGAVYVSGFYGDLETARGYLDAELSLGTLVDGDILAVRF